MQTEMRREAAGFLIGNRRHRVWRKLVSVLACMVVFCTTYALILPAITMEKAPRCGMEEHTHTEECYTQVTTVSKSIPVCSVESLGIHQHTDECLDENGEHICGYAAYVVHRHDESCYDENGNLWCPIPETAPEITPHQHDDSCLDENGNRICNQAEAMEHIHSEDCFQSVEEALDTQALTCTVPEGEGAHTHSAEAGCFDEKGELICQVEESEGHQHGTLCYGIWELTCGMEEHTHSEACYIDMTADLETADVWEATLPEEISDRWSKAVVQTAESQIGYQESVYNYTVDEQGEMHGYTRYGEWYGDPYGSWDAMFASFCLHYAGVSKEAFPQEASTAGWITALQKEECGRYRTKDAYTPKAGDLIFFDWDGDQNADHVGLVAELLAATETEPIKVQVIEGGMNGCVQSTDYSQDDEHILGYGELPQEPRREYRWNDGYVEVIVSVAANEELPENAKLVVEPVLPEENEEAYAEKYTMAQGTIAAEDSAVIKHLELFKIYLEADGQEILPQKEATIEIRLIGMDEPQLLNMETDQPELSNVITDQEEVPDIAMFRYSVDGVEKVLSDQDDASGILSGSFDATLSGEYAVADVEKLQVNQQLVVAPLAGARATQEATILTPHKRIDAFRDGDDNPDTDLDNQNIDKTDLYRLYLDAELSVVSKPIDLLIVVDQSGSMHKDYDVTDPEKNEYWDMTKENKARAYRDEALRLVLNGYSGSDPSVYEQYMKNGLIYQFLAANDENRVAVVGFQGHGYDNYDGRNNYFYGTRYKFKETAGTLDDVTSGKIQTNSGYVEIGVSSGIADANNCLEAETLLPWTDTAAFVNVQGLTYNATNYAAAFIQAQRELDRAKDDGRQKVVLFLSDGIPTCYIAEQQKLVSYWPIKYGHDYFYRQGDGSNDDTYNTDTETDTAFSNFIQANKDQNMILHTVSVRATSAEQRLENMAKDGGGKCYSVSSTEDLEKALKTLMMGATYSKITIQDNLSVYVDLYDKQPDYKVTRTEVDGTVTVLYENGAITDDGKGVLKSVEYDSSKKTVTAIFEPNYTPAPGTKATLSFNVRVKRKAYEQFIKSGYGTVTGEPDTDYVNDATSNETSSNLAGFHSNSSATVSYDVETVGQDGSKHESLDYPHPVVQVATCKVAVKKTDSDNPTKVLPGAEFDLYREAYEGETGVDVEGLTGKYIKISGQYTTDDKGLFVIENLIPGDYWLVETKAPDRYKKPSEPIHFELTRSTDGKGQIVGSSEIIVIDDEELPGVVVTNEEYSHQLPNTGGSGTDPYILGGLLFAAAGILLLYKKRSGKEDIRFS